MENDSRNGSDNHHVKSKLASHESRQDFNSKHVLVLNTGGTIACRRTPDGYAPCSPEVFTKNLMKLTLFHDASVSLSSIQSLPRYTKHGFTPIALPKREDDNIRVFYTIHELLPLLDSSDMDQKDWIRLSKALEVFYTEFDGFVILHGTDTMCYTSSALSFMLENLGKTIVITGAQIPFIEPDSDAISNLYGSIFIAGHFIIPEVSIFCCNKLFRGNRTTKYSAHEFEAFGSPNVPPLAVKGTRFKIEWDIIHRSKELEKFRVHTEMNSCVGVLRIYPGISAHVIKNFFQPPLEGVVLLTFGVGNLPSLDEALTEIHKACERGLVIVNISQCVKGQVTSTYVSGKMLDKAGVVCGHDMTPEAALTKLTYLFGKGYSIERIRKLAADNLRGELTCYSQVNEKDTAGQLLKSMAEHLNLNTKQELIMLRNVLIPPILCAAAKDGDLNMILSNIGDIHSNCSHNLVNLADYDGRTALHLAVSEGHYEVVKCLLELGASLHHTDRWNQSALRCATEYKRFSIIELLLQTGAHLIENETEIGIQTCKAVNDGNLDLLKAWRLSGATLRETDYSRTSPLQLAIKLEATDIIEYFKSIGIDAEVLE